MNLPKSALELTFETPHKSLAQRYKLFQIIGLCAIKSLQISQYARTRICAM